MFISGLPTQHNDLYCQQSQSYTLRLYGESRSTLAVAAGEVKDMKP